MLRVKIHSERSEVHFCLCGNSFFFFQKDAIFHSERYEYTTGTNSQTENLIKCELSGLETIKKQEVRNQTYTGWQHTFLNITLNLYTLFLDNIVNNVLDIFTSVSCYT